MCRHANRISDLVLRFKFVAPSQICARGISCRAYFSRGPPDFKGLFEKEPFHILFWCAQSRSARKDGISIILPVNGKIASVFLFVPYFFHPFCSFFREGGRFYIYWMGFGFGRGIFGGIRIIWSACARSSSLLFFSGYSMT